MRCAWTELLKILPEWMRNDVDKQGSDTLQELRLRLGKPPELICRTSYILSAKKVSTDDIHYCMNAASRYSPWAADSIRYGYLTTSGGHRIGICGQAVVQNGQVQTIRSVSSLCIRVARDFPGIAAPLTKKQGAILIIGRPGCGKTTLLRDLIRQKSGCQQGSIAVVDQRGEIFPPEAGFESGQRTDVLTGCSKSDGIDMLLRCMGPAVIAVDEITAEADAEALLRAAGCGVDLLATAHASDLNDLRTRPIYRKLCEFQIFDWIVILQSDKTWSVERMVL